MAHSTHTHIFYLTHTPHTPFPSLVFHRDNLIKEGNFPPPPRKGAKPEGVDCF